MSYLMSITPWPWASVSVLVLAALVAMYFMRVWAGAFKLASRIIWRTHKAVCERNRDVQLSVGVETKGRELERALIQYGDSLRRDMAGYPDIQRRLNEAVTRLEESQTHVLNVPSEVPAWERAIEKVAGITAADRLEMLEKIHQAMVRSHHEVIEQYRQANRERHAQLQPMLPLWRAIQHYLGELGDRMRAFLGSADHIDRIMKEYREIVAGSPGALSRLTQSALVGFVRSGIILAVAAAGTCVNFALITRPMAEMVGSQQYGFLTVADIAAMIIVAVETSMGLFVMETLGVTHMFPGIGALPRHKRIAMFAVSLLVLTAMACVEGGLAQMRHLQFVDQLATDAVLRGDKASSALLGKIGWIPQGTQIGLSVVLPIALVFAAIPFETFLDSLRTVVGMVIASVLWTLATVLRVLAWTLRRVSVLSLPLVGLVSLGEKAISAGRRWLKARWTTKRAAEEAPGTKADAAEAPVAPPAEPPAGSLGSAAMTT